MQPSCQLHPMHRQPLKLSLPPFHFIHTHLSLLPPHSFPHSSPLTLPLSSPFTSPLTSPLSLLTLTPALSLPSHSSLSLHHLTPLLSLLPSLLPLTPPSHSFPLTPLSPPSYPSLSLLPLTPTSHSSPLTPPFYPSLSLLPLNPPSHSSLSPSLLPSISLLSSHSSLILLLLSPPLTTSPFTTHCRDQCLYLCHILVELPDLLILPQAVGIQLRL